MMIYCGENDLYDCFIADLIRETKQDCDITELS